MTPPKDQAPGLADTDALVAKIKKFLPIVFGTKGKGDYTWTKEEWDAVQILECYTPEIAQGYLYQHDRIEQLEAENAELRGKLEKDQEAMAMFIHAASCSPYMREAVDKVRAALTEQANIRSPVQSEVAKMVDPR